MNRCLQPDQVAEPGATRFERLSLALSLLPLALCFCALTACNEPRKACLDINATNFDAAADEDCCCEYPQLRIDSLLPRFGTLVWKPDTAYQYSPGKWFRMKSIVYYLSGFQAFQNGTPVTVSDTLPFKTWGAGGDTSQTTFVNDFQLIRRSSTSYNIGTFRTSGEFESVQFLVGIPAAAQTIIPGLTPAGHPLRLQSENLWLGRDTGFVALRLIFNRDTLGSTQPDTLTIGRPDFDNLTVKKDGVYKHESGYDFKLKIIADYSELFRDVDLSGGDISALKSKIIANLPNVFRVSQ